MYGFHKYVLDQVLVQLHSNQITNTNIPFLRVNDLFNNGPSPIHAVPEGVVAWEFQHVAFRRDRPELLVRIKRKSSKPLGPEKAAAAAAAAAKLGAIDNDMMPDVNTRNGSVSEASSRESPIVTAKAESLGTNYATSAPARANSGLYPVADYNTFNAVTNNAIAMRDYSTGQQGEFSQLGNDPNQQLQPRPPPSTSNSYPGAYVTGARPVTVPYPSPNSDTISRQVASLDSQVRSLSESLYHSQQETNSARAANYTVLRMLLGLVAGMDPADERRLESKYSLFLLLSSN